MTDCYTCGHPILENQRATPKTLTWAGRIGEVIDEPSHLNPADHLPTGFKTLQKQYAEALGQAYLKEDVRLEERERAAKIVEWNPLMAIPNPNDLLSNNPRRITVNRDDHIPVADLFEQMKTLNSLLVTLISSLESLNHSLNINEGRNLPH